MKKGERHSVKKQDAFSDKEDPFSDEAVPFSPKRPGKQQ
jgi:hypothetical protein